MPFPKRNPKRSRITRKNFRQGKKSFKVLLPWLSRVSTQMNTLAGVKPLKLWLRSSHSTLTTVSPSVESLSTIKTITRMITQTPNRVQGSPKVPKHLNSQKLHGSQFLWPGPPPSSKQTLSSNANRMTSSLPHSPLFHTTSRQQTRRSFSPSKSKRALQPPNPKSM